MADQISEIGMRLSFIGLSSPVIKRNLHEIIHGGSISRFGSRCRIGGPTDAMQGPLKFLDP